MRSLSVHLDEELVVREIRHVLDVAGLGMDHHRHVGVEEGARVEEPFLPAATRLLGGCPQDRDAPVELVGQRREREAGTHARGTDDVVSARVPDARQRVVLTADHHVRTARPCVRDERGFDAEGPALDRTAVCLYQVGESLRGVAFLVRELGSSVDVARGGHEFGGDGVDERRHSQLRLIERVNHSAMLRGVQRIHEGVGDGATSGCVSWLRAEGWCALLQLFNAPANTCHASALLATRLSNRYTRSPYR